MKNSNKENKLPWLNEDGTKKTDAEIAQLGQSWSAQIWNEYLDSNTGTLRDDNLIFVSRVTDETFEKSKVLNFLNEKDYYEEVETALLIALSELSKHERFIIKESFWKMNNNKEIAKGLGKSSNTVAVLKSRAIKKLGFTLSSQKLKNEISHLRQTGRLEKVISHKKQWIKRDSLIVC